VIDGCHACSMRQLPVTKQDTFLSSLQQICAKTVTDVVARPQSAVISRATL
jgi:hypothetical protein